MWGNPPRGRRALQLALRSDTVEQGERQAARLLAAIGAAGAPLAAGLGELEEPVAAQRRLVADASHELRTR
ncbi:hypothetical protein [Streptomyces sp. MK37H]|uniref:hypothetical protein n=1 Tax=Streptomyces sp. MK37H TaxID=2699117 RepID=UPI0035A95EE5